MAKQRRYWDSAVFLAYLKKEEDKYDRLQGIIDAINDDEIEIITSAWTFVEVLYFNKEKITKVQADQIKEFFRNEFIIPANVDREIAELARDLWFENEKLENKDAIHVATAIRHKIIIFDTFDDELIKLDGELGNPALKIAKPNIPHQTDLFKDNEEPKKITRQTKQRRARKKP